MSVFCEEKQEKMTGRFQKVQFTGKKKTILGTRFILINLKAHQSSKRSSEQKEPTGQGRLFVNDTFKTCVEQALSLEAKKCTLSSETFLLHDSVVLPTIVYHLITISLPFPNRSQSLM